MRNTRAGDIQDQIIATLGVAPTVDPAAEIERRVAFLADYLNKASASGYVLGISGGVDSTVAGRLAHLACERSGKTFTAVRLPYGAQSDEADAIAAVEFIAPHALVTVNIKASVDAMHDATTPDSGYRSSAQADFVKGNIKARERMVAQYAIAGACGALVIGTDHAAEAVMGFYTKYGDGAADVTPLAGINKRQVRAVGRHLGAPDQLIVKVPTADLEEERPALPDESVYGITYDEIDDYLEGKDVPVRAHEVIEAAYVATAHKRALPVAP